MKLVFHKRTTDSIRNISSFEFTNILKIQTLINPAKLPSGHCLLTNHKHSWARERTLFLKKHTREQLPGGLGNNDLLHQRQTQGYVHRCLLSLWYHPGVWPAHGLYSECIHFRAWLRLCPRRKGTEGDMMHQRKGQQRCWGRDFWLLPLKIKYIDFVCLGRKQQWARQCLC